ncbi:MAG: hypothetical protein STSR0008_26420 [Ignavibacterium sp.]
MLQVVDVELTPNPQALKFILNEKLLRFSSRQFSKKEESKDDPLAKSIFEINGVVSVFYMDRFITIEKSKDLSWSQIQRPFINLIKNFDTNLIPKEDEPKELENTSEILKQINDIINIKVRPALASDGGGIEVLGIDHYTVLVKYQGACGSCPTAIQGTLMAIENLLKRDINPAIQVVME